jgi:hypothetical protein
MIRPVHIARLAAVAALAGIAFSGVAPVIGEQVAAKPAGIRTAALPTPAPRSHDRMPAAREEGLRQPTPERCGRVVSAACPGRAATRTAGLL